MQKVALETVVGYERRLDRAKVPPTQNRQNSKAVQGRRATALQDAAATHRPLQESDRFWSARAPAPLSYTTPLTPSSDSANGARFLSPGQSARVNVSLRTGGLKGRDNRSVHLPMALGKLHQERPSANSGLTNTLIHRGATLESKKPLLTPAQLRWCELAELAFIRFSRVAARCSHLDREPIGSTWTLPRHVALGATYREVRSHSHPDSSGCHARLTQFVFRRRGAHIARLLVVGS